MISRRWDRYVFVLVQDLSLMVPFICQDASLYTIHRNRTPQTIFTHPHAFSCRLNICLRKSQLRARLVEERHAVDHVDPDQVNDLTTTQFARRNPTQPCERWCWSQGLGGWGWCWPSISQRAMVCKIIRCLTGDRGHARWLY